MFVSCSNDVFRILRKGGDCCRSCGGGNVAVSFSVVTPDLGTRAMAGDGSLVTNLIYAVYDENWNLAGEGVVKTVPIAIGTPVNVEFLLISGQTYNFIFWAAAEGAPYTVNLDPAQNGGNLALTLNTGNLVANQETYDAFYKSMTLTVTEKIEDAPVNLTRPFAQLNIGTSDLEDVDDFGISVTHTMVTVKNAYTTMNLKNGEVGDKTDLTYAMAAIPADKDFPLAGYDYLLLNYLLADDSKELFEILTFKYQDKSDVENVVDYPAQQFLNVPIQRNYRTNIYGNLLGTYVSYDVSIDATINGNYNTGSGVGAEITDIAVAINEGTTDMGGDAHPKQANNGILHGAMLSWTPVDGAAKYAIEYSAVDGSDAARTAKFEGANYEFVNQELNKHSEYKFKVLAYDAEGTFIASGVKTAKVYTYAEVDFQFQQVVEEGVAKLHMLNLSTNSYAFVGLYGVITDEEGNEVVSVYLNRNAENTDWLADLSSHQAWLKNRARATYLSEKARTLSGSFGYTANGGVLPAGTYTVTYDAWVWPIIGTGFVEEATPGYGFSSVLYEATPTTKISKSTTFVVE